MTSSLVTCVDILFGFTLMMDLERIFAFEENGSDAASWLHFEHSRGVRANNTTQYLRVLYRWIYYCVRKICRDSLRNVRCNDIGCYILMCLNCVYVRVLFPLVARNIPNPVVNPQLQKKTAMRGTLEYVRTIVWKTIVLWDVQNYNNVYDSTPAWYVTARRAWRSCFPILCVRCVPNGEDKRLHDFEQEILCSGRPRKPR